MPFSTFSSTFSFILTLHIMYKTCSQETRPKSDPYTPKEAILKKEKYSMAHSDSKNTQSTKNLTILNCKSILKAKSFVLCTLSLFLIMSNKAIKPTSKLTQTNLDLKTSGPIDRHFKKFSKFAPPQPDLEESTTKSEAHEPARVSNRDLYLRHNNPPPDKSQKLKKQEPPPSMRQTRSQSRTEITKPVLLSPHDPP